MIQMLDCMVSFFGLDEREQPDYRRYFCYHILAGPGPTEGAGVASVMTLALHDERERCLGCQNFHAVEVGGPAAALAAAVRYLDAYHDRDHLWKVQSGIRGLGESTQTVPDSSKQERANSLNGSASKLRIVQWGLRTKAPRTKN